ncbi:MAG: response regulator transcription factor [Lysobacter sp.]|nr:response regulator transcription factor [Lysobacter sp.]
MAPRIGWQRIRAVGFESGLPPLLVEALHACLPMTRIAAHDAPADVAGPCLVSVGGDEAPEAGLQRIAGTTGLRLAICACGSRGATLPAVAAGAAGVLYLHDGRDDLMRALQAAMAGAPALTATAAQELIAHARGETPAMPGRAPTSIRLTAREREIIALANQGCTFTQAARLMGVQVSTVYTHVRRLYDKLSVNSLPQALHEARRAGLL